MVGEIERLTRLETKMDVLITMLGKMDNLQIACINNDNASANAMQRADSAHARLDQKDKDESKLKWIVYTALIVAILGLVINA